MMSDNTRMTSKIKRVSMVDQACDYIKEYITTQRLKPGDKLPSEGALSAELDVNRLTIRMALQKLSTLGIIETRMGDGSYVKEFSFIPYLNEIYDVYFTCANMDEIYTLRRLIEMESIKQLIETATDEELTKLKETLDEFLRLEEEYVASGGDEEVFTRFLEKDMDFHYQIFLFSHNSIFRDLFLLMRPLIQQHAASISKYRFQNLDLSSVRMRDPHAQLFDCIQRRDWKACKAVYPLISGDLPSAGNQAK